MARPEQCSDCTKKTTIHFTQIINNKVYKLDMCEDCPLKKDVIDPGNFSLSDIFQNEDQGTPDKPQEVGDLVCDTCGLTQVDFEKRGRFGCTDCYKHFEPVVQTMVKDMHYGTSHTGKTPKMALERVEIVDQVKQMKLELEIAIESEDFEQAAVLRDKILELENQLEILAQE